MMFGSACYAAKTYNSIELYFQPPNYPTPSQGLAARHQRDPVQDAAKNGPRKEKAGPKSKSGNRDGKCKQSRDAWQMLARYVVQPQSQGRRLLLRALWPCRPLQQGARAGQLALQLLTALQSLTGQLMRDISGPPPVKTTFH